MSFNVQSADVRENYRTALSLIAQANGLMKPDPKNPGLQIPDVSKIDRQQITQGYLCTMADVSPNTQTIQFTVVDTQQVSGSPLVPYMRLLSMQDSFVIGSMSYFLMLYYYGVNQQSPVFNTPYYITPITYPSAFHDNENNVLGPGGTPASEYLMDPGCALFWNPGAYISIEVDKKVVTPYWDVLKHLYVPRTQASSSPNPVQGPPYNWPQTQDQYDGSTDAYFPVEPTIVLGGGRQNIIKLNLPANVPGNILPFNAGNYLAASNGFSVKAVLMFHGILAQNSTSVK